MTSRENIALQLTLSSIDTIRTLSKTDKNEFCNNMINFYNTIFENIKTSELPKLELK